MGAIVIRRSAVLALMLAASTMARAAEPVPAPVNDPAKAEIAEEKAAVLEEKVATEGPPPDAKPAERITPVEAQAVDPNGSQPLDDTLTCLARTIYWEAKGEDRAGMSAIAAVVMNRLGKDKFPDTVCGVVTQGKETGACQFSWWCDGKADDVEEKDRYAIAKEVAREALNGQLKDPTGGATYFYSGKKAPDWADDFARTAAVGDHYFYKPKN